MCVMIHIHTLVELIEMMMGDDFTQEFPSIRNLTILTMAHRPRRGKQNSHSFEHLHKSCLFIPFKIKPSTTTTVATTNHKCRSVKDYNKINEQKEKKKY